LNVIPLVWPWGHAAAGYLLYTLYLRTRYDRRPEGVATIVLGFGTQFPDLIDKPLAWTFGVLPTGRTLGHSLVIALLVLAAVRIVRNSQVSDAFAIGYLSHLATDALYPFVSGEFSDLSFFVWPILSSPDYETGQSFLAHLRGIEGSPTFLFEIVLAIVAFGVWLRHGRPGLATLWRAFDEQVGAMFY
jgi:hypothetical protein